MMKGGMAGLMKQAQQMQEKMAKMQEELANAEVTGKAGGDMVTVVMTGRHDVKRVSIDPTLLEGVSEDDREVLEGLNGGDAVVLDPPEQLADGSRVRIAREEPADAANNNE